MKNEWTEVAAKFVLLGWNLIRTAPKTEVQARTHIKAKSKFKHSGYRKKLIEIIVWAREAPEKFIYP